MNFIHSGCMGDCVYALPTIKSIQRQRAERFSKANLWLRPDVPETIPEWAGQRQGVRMTRQQTESLIPLLKIQEGIGDVALYDGQPVDIDLDRFRDLDFNFLAGDVGRYQAYPWRAAPALYERWIRVEPSDRFKGCVLVNRTRRYLNERIDYKFLSRRPDVVFVGFADEYSAFSKDVHGIPHEQAPDTLELARWIAGAKAFVGNQSFCWALAEAMKVPRLLEVFPRLPNNVVHGPKGWDAIDGESFRAIAEDLLRQA